MDNDSGTPSRSRRRFGRIRKLPSGRWQAGYTGPDGTVHQAGETFPTKAAAERWLSLAEADIVRGEWSAPERRAETVGEWAERWLMQGQWRAQTTASYRAKLRSLVLPRWKNAAVGDVTREDVRAWAADLATKGYSTASIRHGTGTLARVLALAVESGAIPTNPCDRLRLATPRPAEIRVLTTVQVEALAHAIEHPVFKPAGHGAHVAAPDHRPDLALWVRLAAYCGLRAGELGALRRKRIDLGRQVLQVAESLVDVNGHLSFGPPKSGKSRAVPIPSSLAGDLRRHMAASVGADPDALVLTSENGEPIRHSNLYRRHFKPAAEQAGLPSDLRFHDLRHAYAALLISLGAHPRAIMERMGHSSITVTLGTYGHLLPSLETELTRRMDEAIGSASEDPIARILHGPSGPTTS